MTGAQYCEALYELGLSKRRAGPLLGATERASRRWSSGSSGVPTAVAILLRLMMVGQIRPSDLERARNFDEASRP
jgi:hypothetical protein